MIKPDHLLSTLNQISNIQIAMEKRQTRLPFLDIMINQRDRKIWMDIYDKPTDSKNAPPTKNDPWHCLANIPLSLSLLQEEYVPLQGVHLMYSMI